MVGVKRPLRKTVPAGGIQRAAAPMVSAWAYTLRRPGKQYSLHPAAIFKRNQDGEAKYRLRRLSFIN